MFRGDYAQFRVMLDYYDAEETMEILDELLEDDHKNCVEHGPLDQDFLTMVSEDIKPALAAAMAKVEEVYDHLGADTNEMDEAVNTMIDCDDRARMALSSIFPATDEDFDISNL